MVKRSREPRNKDDKFVIMEGDCKHKLSDIEDASVSLVFTSPPYNIGKVYESSKVSLDDYLAEQKEIIYILASKIKNGGSVCWQVGNSVTKGAVIPLDLKVHPLFIEAGFTLHRRFVWAVGHGLHCTNRFSGRHETISWYTKGPTPATPPHFPADFVEIEWELARFDVTNVKYRHPEKTNHPCQFPIELVERFILTLTDEGDTVLDPFCGAGTTPLAAVRHDRIGIGIELMPEYTSIAKDRHTMFLNGQLRVREMGTPIFDHSKDKQSKRPAAWEGVINPSLAAEEAYDSETSSSHTDLAILYPYIAVDTFSAENFVTSINEKHRERMEFPWKDGKEGNVCIVIDHGVNGFRAAESEIFDEMTRTSWLLRNRIVVCNKGRHGVYTSIMWFQKENTEAPFDLDAVRVPSKYPGKRCIRSEKFSGNPLGKNPSDVWNDCCGSCDVHMGLSECHWRRVVRSLSTIGSVVNATNDEAKFDSFRDIFHSVKRVVACP